MQTDTHIEVISPYHCYDCSRHTGMNFYNYESPCQMMVNPMPVTSLLHGRCGECHCQCPVANSIFTQNAVLIYTLNHKKRDILFLTITLANLRRFL